MLREIPDICSFYIFQRGMIIKLDFSSFWGHPWKPLKFTYKIIFEISQRTPDNHKDLFLYKSEKIARNN